MILGEDNIRFHTDLYPCTFSKLIESWRNIWHERTNFSTDPTFPFGIVQVRILILINFIFYSFFCSYQQEIVQVMSLEAFRPFVGIKHLMLDMYQIMLYQMFSWLPQWIYVMMMHRKNVFCNLQIKSLFFIFFQNFYSSANKNRCRISFISIGSCYCLWTNEYTLSRTYYC